MLSHFFPRVDRVAKENRLTGAGKAGSIWERIRLTQNGVWETKVMVWPFEQGSRRVNKMNNVPSDTEDLPFLRIRRKHPVPGAVCFRGRIIK
jgi:hypothetical protein